MKGPSDWVGHLKEGRGDVTFRNRRGMGAERGPAGMQRALVVLNLLWFATLAGSSFFVAIAMTLARRSTDAVIGPGLPPDLVPHLEGGSVVLTVLVLVAGWLFSHRIMRPMPPKTGETIPSLPDADPRLQAAFAALRPRLFILSGLLELPVFPLLVMGLVDNREPLLWLAVAYGIVAALLFRPSFRRLLSDSMHLEEGN